MVSMMSVLIFSSATEYIMRIPIPSLPCLIQTMTPLLYILQLLTPLEMSLLTFKIGFPALSRCLDINPHMNLCVMVSAIGLSFSPSLR